MNIHVLIINWYSSFIKKLVLFPAISRSRHLYVLKNADFAKSAISHIWRNIYNSKLFFCLRILPTYVTMILVTAFILPYMGNGPIWKLVIYPDAHFCRQNWWTNLLFLNNYVNSSEMVIDWYYFVVYWSHFITYSFISENILIVIICEKIYS